MPKLKTHKGTKKRVRMTATGKAKRSCAFKSHILTKKTRARKRKLRMGAFVDSTEARKIRRLLPYD
jgi:large subunit ribosomal protein L35